MQRITKSDVLNQLSGINDLLAEKNLTYRLALHGRYNYHVIERVNAKDQHITVSDPIVAGTMRECYNYAAAMLRGMWTMQ